MGNSDLTRDTRAYYDDLIREMGEGYLDFRWSGDPVRSSHYIHTRDRVDQLLSSIGPVEHMLEVGCGPGTWTEICLRHAERMTLLDISEEMLKVARSRFAGQSNIRYICGDFVEPLPDLSGEFDLVFSARALEYMSDKRAAVDRVWSYLRPGGRAVLITKNPDWRDKRRDERRRRRSDSGGPAGDIQRDWIGWRQLMEHMAAAGFTDLEAFPVAFGSYEWPLPRRVGVAFSEVIRRLWGGRPMRGAVDWISESYAVVGRKPAAR